MIRRFGRVIVALAGLSANAASAECPPPFSGSGDATFYDINGVNRCTLPTGDGMVAALNSAQYGNSEHCGECLLVAGPEGVVLVKVVDECPGCLVGDLDLSEAAFDAIADPVDGRVLIAWERVECPVSGPVRFRFQGSNPFYFKLQADNHRYGISAMDYFDGMDWVPMSRTIDNHFQASGIPNITDAQVRVAATTGEVMIAHVGDPESSAFVDGPEQFAVCDAALFADGFESP